MPDESQQLLPLDLDERVSVVKFGGRFYYYAFHRITSADWDGFFSRIEAELEDDKGAVNRMTTSDVGALWLFSEAAIRAERSVSDGRAAEDLPTWKAKIPQDHCIAAVNKLTAVWIKDLDDVLEAEGERVELDAFWTASRPVNGMLKFCGLVHRFNTPSADQRRRFQRARHRVRVVGGSRSGRTMISCTLSLLAKLYDELIQSVEGYSVNGRPLGGRDEVIREMDAYHKASAAAALFPARTEEETEVVVA